jgi:hypothetical protein
MTTGKMPSHVDMTPIAEFAAVTKAEFFCEIRDVVHRTRGAAPSGLIEIASLSAVVQRIRNVSAGGVAMDLPRVVAARDKRRDKGHDLRLEFRGDRYPKAGRRRNCD